MKRFTLALALAASLFSSPLPAAVIADPAPSALKIVIPKVDFREATLRESLEFLGQRAKALDPDGQGVNIIIKSPSEPATPPAPDANPTPGTGVTLTLNNVPLGEVIQYIAKLANCTLRMDPGAVVVIAPVNGKKPAEKPRPEVPIADGLNFNKIVKPLQDTKIPKVDFRESTLAEALDFLSQRAKALLPGGKGLNIVLKADAAKDRRITFAASNLSIIELLRYTAELADVDLSIEEFAVVVSDPKAK